MGISQIREAYANQQSLIFIMLTIGLGISFIGYSLAYYGLTQIRGGNWGLWDLVLPSHWDKVTAGIKTDGELDGKDGSGMKPGGGMKPKRTAAAGQQQAGRGASSFGGQ